MPPHRRIEGPGGLVGGNPTLVVTGRCAVRRPNGAAADVGLAKLRGAWVNRVMRVRSPGMLTCWVCALLLDGPAVLGAEQGPAPTPSVPAASSAQAAQAEGTTPPASEGADAAVKKRSGPTGFSWTDAPKSKSKSKSKPRARRRAPPVDLSKPLATYPGFRMLQDGRSEVWLLVTRQVAVSSREAKGEVVYFIEGAQVGVNNNTNPLVTTHFNTPVSRAYLRRVKRGAELVVVLREPVAPTHATTVEPGGTMVLRVTVGKAHKDYASESLVPGPQLSSRGSGPPAPRSARSTAGPWVLPEAGPQL